MQQLFNAVFVNPRTYGVLGVPRKPVIRLYGSSGHRELTQVARIIPSQNPVAFRLLRIESDQARIPAKSGLAILEIQRFRNFAEILCGSENAPDRPFTAVTRVQIPPGTPILSWRVALRADGSAE